MPPLRIAINARLLAGQPLEGMGRYVVEVTRELMRHFPGAAFLLLTDRKGAMPPLATTYERAVVYPPARHPLLFYVWYEWAVPRALRRWRADVFVSLDNFCSLRTPVPTVLAVHDLVYLHYPGGMSRLQLAYYRRFMPRYVRRADCLLAVSEATKVDIVRAYGLCSRESSISPKHVTVAPNGVRPRFVQLSPKHADQVRASVTGGAPYFVAVGSVHPRKNIDGLIRAFDRFCESETTTAARAPHHLVIVGRMAWQTSAVERALAASPHRDRIHLTGFVEDERLGELIGAATALALVSLFEGFGVPILEAFACGVPVVVSDRSSLPEVAGAGGLVVDPTDTEAVAAALMRLATEPGLRQVLAEAGRAHAQQYTWERSGRIIAEAIHSCVRKPHSDP